MIEGKIMESMTKMNIKNIKSKAVKWFAVFLVFMLLCTIISRGIYAYLMPQVEVGRMERKSIPHTVEVSGNVVATREEAVLVPDGMLVEEICVREGETVSQDTLLFRLNTAKLEEKLEELENRIALCEQRLEECQAIQDFSAKERQIEASRAKEDLENITKTQDLSLARAKQQYEDAQNTLNNYPSWEAYYDNKIRQDMEYQRLLNDPEQTEVFQIYAKSLQFTLQSEWSEGRKMLENSVKEAEVALQMADNDRKLAILQAKRSVEDAEREICEEKSNVMEEEQTLKSLQKESEICQNLWKQEGKIFSKVAGSVKAISISTGSKTSDTAAMILSDASEGWVFEALLTGEQMLLLNMDDTVTLSFRNGKKTLENRSLAAINKVDDENYLVTVEGNGESMLPGQMGTLKFVKQEGPYSCCVPLSAIHTEGNKKYIYVLREVNTILGTELRLVRRRVEIIDQNDSYAALKEDSLSREEQFVIDSNREIASGDTVRLMEDE